VPENEYQLVDEKNLAAIKANVEVVKTVLAENLEVRLDLDEQSIEWLDGYVERNREFWEPEVKQQHTSILGSFLGEAIVKNYGGQWAYSEGSLGIDFGNDTFAFPFNKVAKHIENGAEDSIFSFYKTTSMVANGSIK